MYIKTHLCFGTVSTGVDSLWSIFCLTQNFEIMSFYCVLSLMGYLKGGCSRSGEMESHVCNMLMTGLKEEAGKKVGQRVEDGKKNQAREQVEAMPQPPRPSLCLILQSLFIQVTGLLLSRSSELLVGLRGG